MLALHTTASHMSTGSGACSEHGEQQGRRDAHITAIPELLDHVCIRASRQQDVSAWLGASAHALTGVRMYIRRRWRRVVKTGHRAI